MKFRDDLPEGGDAKNYIRLKDKEAVTGIFRGDPYEYAAVWENKKSTEVAPGTPGARFRFKINFVVKEGSVYVAKIFENSQTVYKQLADLSKEWDLETTVVKVMRTGSSIADTAYNIIPTPQALTPETKAHLKTVKLHELGPRVSAGAPPPAEDTWPEGPTFDSSDEIPF